MLVLDKRRYKHLVNKHDFKGDFIAYKDFSCYACKKQIPYNTNMSVIQQRVKNYQRVICPECRKLYKND